MRPATSNHLEQIPLALSVALTPTERESWVDAPGTSILCDVCGAEDARLVCTRYAQAGIEEAVRSTRGDWVLVRAYCQRCYDLPPDAPRQWTDDEAIDRLLRKPKVRRAHTRQRG